MNMCSFSVQGKSKNRSIKHLLQPLKHTNLIYNGKDYSSKSEENERILTTVIIQSMGKNIKEKKKGKFCNEGMVSEIRNTKGYVIKNILHESRTRANGVYCSTNAEFSRKTGSSRSKTWSKNKKQICASINKVYVEYNSAPFHDWVLVGKPEVRTVANVHVDMLRKDQLCYPSIRHSIYGDVINVRDCVLLRPDIDKSDVSYVAKVGAFWEHPKSKSIMMSLLWYYHPEHTESGRELYDMPNEIFASRHRDESSVACIDDKCYVLTYNQYCRYQADVCRYKDGAIPRRSIVPTACSSSCDCGLLDLPTTQVDPANVFCCRKVYDFRSKRILKNPS